MNALIIAELMRWGTQCGRRTLLTMICIATITGGLTLLQPQWWLEAMTGAFLWLGFMMAVMDPEREGRRWIVKKELSALQLTIGKLINVALVGLLHSFVLLPVIRLMLIMWGIPWHSTCQVFLVILIGTVTMAVLNLFPLHFQSEDGRFLNFLVSCLWLGTTGCIPQLRLLNPFFAVWQIINQPQLLWVHLMFGMVFIIGLVGMETFLLGREVRRDG